MSTGTTPLWAAATAAVLMVSLRCAPAAFPGALVARHANRLTLASRAAIGLALAYALYQMLQLDRAGLVASFIFVTSGLVVFLAFRTLAGAILGAAAAYGAYLLLA